MVWGSNPQWLTKYMFFILLFISAKTYWIFYNLKIKEESS
nr:MAG TPA: hypothetical protein [Caudoviricetes sp.]